MGVCIEKGAKSFAGKNERKKQIQCTRIWLILNPQNIAYQLSVLDPLREFCGIVATTCYTNNLSKELHSKVIR